MFKILRGGIRKIIALCLVLGVLQLFLIGYVFSLVIVKPRDVTEIFLLISKYFIDDSDAIDIDSKKITMSWNRSEFSFDLNFIDNKVRVGGHIVSIPHLVVDISKRSLFIWKFKIDQMKIQKLEYEISKGYQLTKNNVIRGGGINVVLPDLLFDILNDRFKQLSYLGNVKIYQLLVSVLNEEGFVINNLELEQIEKIGGDVVKLSFALQIEGSKEIGFDGICHLTNNHHVKNCKLQVNNISDDFMRFVGLEILDLSMESDFLLEIEREGDSYVFKSNVKIDQIEAIVNNRNYKYQKMELESDILVSKESILVKNFSSKIYDINEEKNVSLALQYVFENRNLNFKLYGHNLDEGEIFILWPEKVLFKTRRWLKKSLLRADLSEFNLASSMLLTGAKPKLNSLRGEFYFKNTDLKFVRFFKPVRNAAGVVSIVDKRLDIKVKEAVVAGTKLFNFSAVIPYLKKGRSVLNIDGKLDIGGKSLLSFLLGETMSHRQLGLLYKLFGKHDVNGELDLSLKLKKPFTSHDFKLDFLGEIRNFSKPFHSNSKVALVLDKKFGTEVFAGKLDFIDSEVSLPFVKYDKHYGSELSANFKAYKTKSEMVFEDITLLGNKEYVNGNVSFSKRGLEVLNIAQAQLGKNYFSLDYEVKDQQKDFQLNIEEMLLRPINLADFSGRKSSKLSNLTLNTDIKFLSFADRSRFNNIKSKYVCGEVCDFFYLQGGMKKKDKIFVKYFLNQKKQPKLIMETSNLGYVLDTIGITDKLLQGDFHFSAEKIEEKFVGKALLSNFYIKKERFFKKISELKIYRNKELENQDKLLFEKGVAQVSFDNKSLSIRDTVFYGKLLGITTEGEINFAKNMIDLEGLIVPAYKINNLLGVKDIPIIGKIITGGKNKGLLSAGYDVKGKIKNPEFNFNPLTVVLPSFLRNIVDLLSFKKDKDVDNTSL